MTTAAQPRRRGRPGYDRDGLLAGAVAVFTRKGYDGTTMEDLAEGLGITKSAIYHHVSSKESLLALALDEALSGLDEVVAASRALDAPADERLALLLHDSVRVLFDRRPFVTLLLRVHGNSQTERDAIIRRRAFDRYASELVAEAAAAGQLHPVATPEVTARLLFGMVNSLIEWAKPRGEHEIDRLADAIVQITFGGLRHPEGR